MSILDYIREQFNDHFIEDNAMVVGEMQRYYKKHGRPENSADRAKLALRLFAEYAVLKKNPIRIKQKNFAKQIHPESCEKRQVSEKELQERFENADVIVFDLWNVLVYPALDVRQLLALFETVMDCPGISGYIDFNLLTDQGQCDCLEEIGMDFCLDNEYMHNIWNCAQAMGKRVYLYNNSEFGDSFSIKTAEKLGYRGEIYQEDPCKALYITADYRRKSGICYQNVNELGESYRPFYYKNIVTALYNQIVNLKFHAGQMGKTIFYEYGFICGGILTCGFCQYLNELAKQEKIDKFLFVARDGDIIKKVYDRYYKEYDTSYLIFSRFASYEIIFEDFPEEYIEKNIKLRMLSRRRKHTIGKILQECGLGCLGEYLEGQGLSYTEELGDKNYIRFKHFLLRYKDIIAEKFHDSSVAAEQYFMQEIQGYNRVCIVDLGWRGTSVVYLKHLFEKKYKWSGSVTGAVIGVALDDVTQIYVRNGILHAYAFDNELYRRMGTSGGEYMSQAEIFCIEALFSAKEPTLLRYKLDADSKVSFIYGSKNKNGGITAEIQRGIMDYAKECAPLLQKYELKILPGDAYMPLDFCMQNRRYRDMICRAYAEEEDGINGF